ncbi:hypothetical protein ACHAW6_000307 [Cyclotella cf. meneghiniana]
MSVPCTLCAPAKRFKTELDHLVVLRILAPTTESEWASPSFIVPKKDGCVHWISDLCKLNKVIRYKQYLLPIIIDILCKCSGYKFFTKLDISLQYYTFTLDEHSQDLCTIITPFGKLKTVLLLTHLNVNGPSKRLTGWVIGLLQGSKILEEKNRCNHPHGSPSECR